VFGASIVELRILVDDEVIRAQEPAAHHKTAFCNSGAGGDRTA
jgi:hypothetical protein